MKLTELESKIMKIIWKLDGKASVNDVLDNWEESKIPKYTTVLKIFQILEDKKIVTHKKKGRSYVYSAKVSKKESLRFSITKIVKDFFEGNKFLLANNLIGENSFTYEELQKLKQTLKEKEATLKDE